MARQTLTTAFGLVALLTLSFTGSAQDVSGADLQEALNDNAAAFWIYDDLSAAEAIAKKSGKPLLITFRCVP